VNVKVNDESKIKMKMKKVRSCWVYVLECGDGSYYTGWTNDLAKRVKAHQGGKGGKYTRSRLPVRLIKKWRAKNRSEAMGKEAFFKSLSRKEKEIKLG
jgi:putative endonuclease